MSLRTDLSERWRALFRREGADRELDEELSFHIDQDIAARVARGADPDVARRDAMIALGGISQVTEGVREARGVGPLEDLAADIRHAFRLIRANPMFATTVTVVLGGALGAATAVFAIADSSLFSDGRYGVSDRLVRIYQSNSPANRWGLSAVDALALLEHQRTFDAIGFARRGDVALVGAGAPERAVAAWATSGFLAAVDARAEIGRVITRADELESAPPVALVSHALALERFGDASAVGRDLVADGVHHTIIGVLPPAVVELGGIRSRLWLPLKISTPRRRGPFWLRGIGRLRPGVSIDLARRDLTDISQQLFPVWAASFRDRSAVLTPFPLRDTILGDAPKRIALFGAAVLLVWLIALANVATLTLLRASARDQELGIRLAVGATRGRIARLLVTDSVVLTGLAGLVGMTLAILIVPFARLVAPELPHIADASVGGRTMLFAAAAAIVSGVLVTIPPLVATLGRARPLRVDARRIGRDLRSSWLRAVLVSAEFALALPLVASAFWFVQTIWRLQAIDPGFAVAGAVTLNIQLTGPRYTDGQARATFWRRLDDRARLLPGVTAVGYAGSIPPDDPSDINNFDLLDRPARGGAEPTAPWNEISSGFLEALGVRLVDGRDFTAAEYASGSDNALVSASWARHYFPGQSALGRKMVSGGCTSCPLTEVVGVVSDVKYQGLDGNSDVVYQVSNPENASALRLVARTSLAEDETIRALTNTVHSIDGAVLVEASTFRARLGDALTQPKHWTALVGSFAAAAGTLAALGLFGLMSYIVRQQRRDIGVRLALGATPLAMTWMVVRRGVRYALTGSCVGVALAIIAGRWLLTSSFGIQSAGGLVILSIAGALTAVAALASWWPGHQASRIPTMEAMSVE